MHLISVSTAAVRFFQCIIRAVIAADLVCICLLLLSHISAQESRGSAPNMGTFLVWAPLISVPYVTYATEVRHVFCAPGMAKSS